MADPSSLRMAHSGCCGDTDLISFVEGDCSLGDIRADSSGMLCEEESVGDGRKESSGCGSDSMVVRRVMVSSGYAKWICEIGEHGEKHDPVSVVLAVSSSSSDTKRSSDNAV